MKKLHNCLIYLNLIVLIMLLCIPSSYGASWYKGDLHKHTGYSTRYGYDGELNTASDNCVLEYVPVVWDPPGYDVSDLNLQALALGLHTNGYWFSLTDHSYCLNENEWNILEGDCDYWTGSSLMFMPGEELSVSEDCGDETAHLGAHGISSFIAQSPPGNTSPDSPGSQEGINIVNNDGGVSIINHPFLKFNNPVDFDSWMCTSGETGIEVWNEGEAFNIHSADNDAARTKWVVELLNNEKTYAYGGTDSHDEISTTVYNYAYLDSFNTASLKKALKEGKVSVSNNGLLYLEAYNSNWKNWTLQGSTMPICSGDEVKIKATYNLGGSCDLRIIKGIIGQSSEDGSWVFNGLSGSGNKEAMSYPTSKSYFRAECIGGTTNQRRIYTNPIWVEIDNSYSDADSVCDSNDCNKNNQDIYPGNSNIYCDCDSSDGYAQGTTEINGDGVDNDCDGQVDEGSSCTSGQTRNCPKQNGVCAGSYETCTNGQWPGCDYSAWSSYYQANEMLCGDNKDNDCDGYVDQDDEDDCTEGCESNEDDVQCTVYPDDMVQMDWTDDTAQEKDRGDTGLISGSDYGNKLVYASNFEVDDSTWSDCANDIEDNVGDIFDVDIYFRNNLGEEWDCSDTDLEIYTRDEDHFSMAEYYQEQLTSSTNWNNVINNLPYCDYNLNEYGITPEFKNDLNDDDADEIAYGWNPDSNQDLWGIRRVGENTFLRIWYCEGCTDNDGDFYHAEDLGCGADDCNDDNPYIFPDNSNNYCDCDDSDGYSEGGAEICDNTDNDCDGTTNEGCDNDNDHYCNSGMSYSGSNDCPNGGNDCDDSNSAIHPGALEVCDNIDNDCDEITDEGCDDDNDDYCDANLYISGTPGVCPSGGNDCNDNLLDNGFNINPSASEICNDGLDNDCDDDADCVDSDCQFNENCYSAKKLSFKKGSSVIAWFDENGNLVLKNTLTQSATPTDTADDEFLLRDDSNVVIAKINSTGYMEIKGTLQQNQGSLTDPPGDDFLIKEDDGTVVAYINESGYMFLKGGLYENYG